MQTRLAAAIKLYLQFYTIRQKDIALLLGITESSFSRFLNGNIVLSLEDYKKLENWLLSSTTNHNPNSQFPPFSLTK